MNETLALRSWTLMLPVLVTYVEAESKVGAKNFASLLKYLHGLYSVMEVLSVLFLVPVDELMPLLFYLLFDVDYIRKLRKM